MSERVNRIIELARNGLSPSEIQKQVGGSVGSISVRLCGLRKKGVIDPGEVKDPFIRVPLEVMVCLEDEARKRKMKTADLVRELLRTIANDDLIKAVLDK
jgi:hypothetical protein